MASTDQPVHRGSTGKPCTCPPCSSKSTAGYRDSGDWLICANCRGRIGCGSIGMPFAQVVNDALGRANDTPKGGHRLANDIAAFNERECSGVLGADGQVHSDADPGL